VPNLASDAVEPTEGVQVNTSTEAEKLTTDRIVKAEKLTTTKPDVPHFLLCPSVSNMISLYWLGLHENIIYLKNILPADFSDCRRGYHEKAGGGLLANSTATYYPIILQGWLSLHTYRRHGFINLFLSLMSTTHRKNAAREYSKHL